MNVAKISYYCPIRGTWYTVGSNDYEVGVKHFDKSKLRISIIYAEVNCLCGYKHELFFGEQ
jgi:hypothetical protein